MQVEVDDIHVQGPKSMQHLRDLGETIHLEDRFALADGGSYFTYPSQVAEAAIRQLPAIGQLDARTAASKRNHLFEIALGDQFAAIDQQHAIANALRLFHVVSAVNYARARIGIVPNPRQ